MSSYSQLRDLGFHHLLREAALEIDRRGFSAFTTWNPETDEIDIEGALLTVCGVKKLPILFVNPAILPQSKSVSFYIARNVIQATCGEDLDSWSQTATKDEAVLLLRRSALFVEASIA